MNKGPKSKKPIFRSRIFQVAIRLRENDFLFENKLLLNDFILLKNSILYWNADPFVERIGDKYFVFVERCNRVTCRGFIAFAELDILCNRKIRWKKMIAPNYHLSFPFVFKNKNENNSFYLMPESSENNSIDLYRFNYDFKLICKTTVLSNVSCVDSVIYNDCLISYSYNQPQNELRFYCKADSKSDNYALYKTILDDYYLRPAGKVFDYKGKIVFVSQDCSLSYGGGILFRYFDICKDSFPIMCSINAQDVNQIKGTKKYCGIHTYNYCDKYEVIDLAHMALDPLSFIGKIVSRLRKMRKKHEKK